MRKSQFLVGLSAIALSATAAQAQNNTNSATATGVGNTTVCINNSLNSNGNNCTISVTGDNNSATVRQPGDNNTGTITIVGNSNTATIEQPGDSNTAQIEQRANGVFAFIEQGNADAPGNADYAVTSGAPGVASENNNVSENNYALTRQLAGSDGSRSSTTQNGDLNSTTVTQTGANSDSFARVAGFNNTATVNQSGVRSASTIIVRNFANDTATTGVPRNNSVSVTQSGADTESYVSQDGRGNVASVTLSGNGPFNQRPATNQTDDQRISDYFNQPDDSAVIQVGVENQATVNIAADLGQAFIAQAGAETFPGNANQQNALNNTASVTQASSATSSIGYVFQGGRRNIGSSTQGARSSFSQIYQNGDDNTATVNQSAGNDLRSVISQLGAAGEAVRGNTASVTMSNGGSAALTNGVANASTINQRSAGNDATVIIAGGDLQRNTSAITQTGSGNVAADGNEAFVSLSRGDQMASTISQNGTVNYAEVTMTSGVQGVNVVNDPQPGQGLEQNRNGGNNSTINQTNRGSVAVVTTQAARGVQFRGLGNNITINQTGASAFAARGAARANQTSAASEGRLGYTEFGQTIGNFAGANGQYVETYQQGRFDTATVTQNVNGDSGRVYANGAIARARGAIYQNASVDTATLTQTGDNYGEITQALGQGSTVNLTQTDAGDITNPGTPGGTIPQTTCDQFGNCTTTQVPDPNNPGTPTTFTRQYNQALVTQYGNSNLMALTQNARNGYLSAFQRQGSSNLVLDFEQGTGRTNAFAGSNSGAPSVDPAIGNGAVPGASTNATANLEQGGTNNGAQVSQDSSNSFVTVVQLGTGSGPVTATDFQNGVIQGTTSGGNLIIVAQQGTNNRATARQEAGVGRSAVGDPQSGNSAADNTALNGGQATPADDFFFAGGSRSAEIDILQGGSGNTASATQRGLGQYARIEQAGSSNTATILQESTATNATAIIRQSGSGNSYYVTQTQPGQYIAVDQFGTNNNANNIVTRGAVGGTAGFGPPPGS
jgi:trimeric autotransporter adhesin